MKTLVMAATVFAAFFVFAEDADKDKVYPVPPSKMAEFNAKTGGLVEPPADARNVVLLDAREKDMSTLTNLADAAERLVAVGCEIRKIKIAATDDPWKLALAVKQKGAGAVVLFYERADVPVLSAFPEDAIVLVNLQPLQNPEYVVYRRRLVKEFWRALAFAIGGYGNPMQMGSALQPAFSIKDLDEIRGVTLTPLQINAIAAVKSRLGIYGKRAVPYSRACREGWAPSPTNDVQKALFERFRDPGARFKGDFK